MKRSLNFVFKCHGRSQKVTVMVKDILEHYLNMILLKLSMIINIKKTYSFHNTKGHQIANISYLAKIYLYIFIVIIFVFI